MEALLYWIGGFVALGLLGVVLEWREQAMKYKSELAERGTIEKWRADIEEWRLSLEVYRRETEHRAHALTKLAAQKSQGFPYLAAAWDDYLKVRDHRIEAELAKKSRPAPVAAAAVREMSREKREAIQRAKIFEYKNRLYEALFPWLTEFTDEGIDDAYIRVGPAADAGVEDPAKRWIPTGEWEHLSAAQRNQRALDRFQARPKTNWEIGREYERYVGYLYEKHGCNVNYMGAVEGFDDLGRDLVVVQGSTTRIVQCKYWAEFRQIHEKHVFQLFGTSVEYALRKRFGEQYERQDLFGHNKLLDGILPEFYTSSKLTDRARAFAGALGIAVFELFKLEPYPLIKCNVARPNGEKIYHLPFDQQYDKVRIELERGERYVATVAEAERLGFRRAYRWHPEAS